MNVCCVFACLFPTSVVSRVCHVDDACCCEFRGYLCLRGSFYTTQLCLKIETVDCTSRSDEPIKPGKMRGKAIGRPFPRPDSARTGPDLGGVAQGARGAVQGYVRLRGSDSSAEKIGDELPYEEPRR